MKVLITHLKAPWPAGAAVGDVVDVGDSLPGCFAGKCRPAGDDAEAAHRYEPVLAPPMLADAELAELRESKASATEAFHALREESVKRIEQAQADAAADRKAAEDAITEAAQLRAKVAELEAALAGAGGGPTEARAALEAEATALGVQFRSNIGDEALAQRVAEAKAAKQ